MPIKNIINDYSGRKKDVNIAYRIDPTLADAQPLDLRFGSISSFTAGVQKLVQRYIISMFTAIGSQPNYTTFGTDLPAALGTTGNMNSQELRHTFNFANWKVIGEFRKYQSANPDVPKDEQLNTATLTDFQASGGKVTFNVTLLTLAGENIDFLIPLPIVK